jgi:hypothetical protein
VCACARPGALPRCADDQWRFVKKMSALLEAEAAAFDIGQLPRCAAGACASGAALRSKPTISKRSGALARLGFQEITDA